MRLDYFWMFHHHICNPSCFRPTNFACISIILTRTDTVSEKKIKAQSFAERVFVLLKEKKVCLINWLLFDFFYKFPSVLKGAPPSTKLAAPHFSKVLNIYLHWPPPSWRESFPSISIIYLWQILLLNQTENGKVVHISHGGYRKGRPPDTCHLF